jgi:Domain related to MnhB subunit of Na+/H+ antiporter.
MRPNDVILHVVTKIAVIIIFTFAIDLFWSGHQVPGGGFVGGLAVTGAIVLLYLSFDIETVSQNIPLDFKNVAAVGCMIAIGTGMIPVFFGGNFLDQTFGFLELPIFGETELTTALLFDLGVALAVVGTGVNIILSISGDRSPWKH